MAKRGSKLKEISRTQARRILSALNRGVAPPVGSGRIFVGHRRLWQTLTDELDSLREDPDYEFVRVIVAPVGFGKSTLLRALTEIALERGFAFAYLTVDERGYLVADPSRFATEVLKRIRCIVQGKHKDITHILDAVADRLIGEAAMGDEPIPVVESIRRLRLKVFEVCNELRVGQPSMVSMLIIYTVARWKLTKLGDRSGDPEEIVQLVRKWVVGERLRLDELRRYGISIRIEPAISFDILADFGRLCRWAGLYGPVVALDGTENVLHLYMKVQRERAYQTLVHILDAGIPSCGVFIAMTPSLWEDTERGIRVNPSLASRLGSLAEIPTEETVVHTSVLRLEELSDEELREMLLVISDLYATAYGREFSPAELDEVLGEATRSSPGTPRDWVKTFVLFLDSRIASAA